MRHLLILVLIGGASLSAQSIKVAPSTHVATGSAEHPIVEPHLAVDPMHPDRLLTAAFARANPRLKFPEGQDNQTCAAFLSLDSGASWTRHDFNVSWCADPWVAMTPDGQTLVTMVGKHAALAQQGSSGLVAFHSIDNGRTWDSLPIGLGRSHDHPTMAVDLSAGPHRGWIYLSSHLWAEGRRYGVYIARSRNGGKSFDDPVYVIPNNLHNLAEMPVVLTDGTLFESFVDATYTPDSGGTQAREVLFDRRRAWVTRSSDGGFTFSAPFFVTDACGPPPGYRLSTFAADVSRARTTDVSTLHAERLAAVRLWPRMHFRRILSSCSLSCGGSRTVGKLCLSWSARLRPNRVTSMAALICSWLAAPWPWLHKMRRKLTAPVI